MIHFACHEFLNIIPTPNGGGRSNEGSAIQIIFRALNLWLYRKIKCSHPRVQSIHAFPTLRALEARDTAIKPIPCRHINHLILTAWPSFGLPSLLA
jgi:hypothetical protein